MLTRYKILGKLIAVGQCWFNVKGLAFVGELEFRLPITEAQ
jgi:hypothetical protein